jgi:hypothetical protein
LGGPRGASAAASGWAGCCGTTTARQRERYGETAGRHPWLKHAIVAARHQDCTYLPGQSALAVESEPFGFRPRPESAPQSAFDPPVSAALAGRLSYFTIRARSGGIPFGGQRGCTNQD